MHAGRSITSGAHFHLFGGHSPAEGELEARERGSDRLREAQEEARGEAPPTGCPRQRWAGVCRAQKAAQEEALKNIHFPIGAQRKQRKQVPAGSLARPAAPGDYLHSAGRACGRTLTGCEAGLRAPSLPPSWPPFAFCRSPLASCSPLGSRKQLGSIWASKWGLERAGGPASEQAVSKWEKRQPSERLGNNNLMMNYFIVSYSNSAQSQSSVRRVGAHWSLQCELAVCQVSSSLGSVACS